MPVPHFTKHSKLINLLTSGNAPVALLSSLSSKLTLSALGSLFFYIDLVLASVLSFVASLWRTDICGYGLVLYIFRISSMPLENIV